MKRFFKWLLVVLVLAALVGGVLAGGIIMGWSIQRTGLALLGAALLGLAGFIALRLFSRKPKSRAAPSESGALSERAKARVKAIEQAWKAFVAELKKSRVQGGVDPVAGLPWQLVLGASGGGKSLSMANSGLAGADSGGGGGNDLQWQFLEEAIVFEAPSRFVFHGDESDGAEWDKFLALLYKTRKNEPLNGLIVAVPADLLLAGNQDELKRQGSVVSKRIDEAIRRLGFMVPVYILVTKCDLIAGMTQFFGYFPRSSLSRAMGGLNDDKSLVDPKPFLNKIFDDVYDRLSVLRLVLLGETAVDVLNPHAVIFPEEFEGIKSSLGVYLNSVFERSPYKEKSFFRGLFFSSAAQGSTPLSSFLPGFGMADELLKPSSAKQSYFLKEFFGEIIKRDASIAGPSAKAAGWLQKSRNIGLAAWIALCVAGGILLSYSFARNLSTTRLVATRLPASPHLGREFDANLDLVERLRHSLTEAEEKKGIFPRFGLNHDSRLVDQLRETYLVKFKKGVLEPLDAELDKRLASISKDSTTAKVQDPRRLAAYVNYLSTRINILQSIQENNGLTEAELKQVQQPDFSLVKIPESSGPGVETNKLIAENYIFYLATSMDLRSTSEELDAERSRLRDLLSNKNIGFSWLVDWANMQQSLETVNIGKYWGVRVSPEAGRRVETDKAHTPAGWEAIKTLADSIIASFDDKSGIGKTMADFEGDYSKEYFAIWEALLKNFPAGRSIWRTQTDKTAMADQLANKESPYARILADCPEMLAPAVELAKDENQAPAWVELIYRHDKLNDVEYQKALEAGTTVAGLAATTTGLLSKLKSKLRGVGEDDKLLREEDAKAHKYLKAYRETLRELASISQASQPSYQLAVEAFKDDGVSVGEPKNPAARNFWAQEKYKSLISKRNPKEDVFWKLFSLPAMDLWEMSMAQARINLEERWDVEVREEMKNLKEWELIAFLWGDAGKISAFNDKNSGPFLKRESKRGYAPKVLFGDSLDFSDSFLNLLNMGSLGGKALEKSYSVKISALPTSANPGASKQPHRVKLILACKSGAQEIINLNYPIEKSFTWAPANCSEASLEIGVGDALLSKTYSGHDGFLKFLSDFQSGSKTFRRNEFPEQSGLLAGYNVEFISINYAFEGSGEVLRLGKFRPFLVPERIFNQ